MSTRATIKIEGFGVAKVYKHFDGYPSATLPWLKSFAYEFNKNRGWDPSYMLAQLLRSSRADATTFDLDESDTTGWGVVGYDDDCGQDYEYTIGRNGEVSYEEC